VRAYGGVCVNQIERKNEDYHLLTIYNTCMDTCISDHVCMDKTTRPSVIQIF